jgi:hypothetical protein
MRYHDRNTLKTHKNYRCSLNGGFALIDFCVTLNGLNPRRGQTPDQLSKDRYECHTGIVQQSGFDRSSGDTGKDAAIGATAGGLK